MNKLKQQGVTLLEMMLVIIVIAVLSLLALGYLNKKLTQAKILQSAQQIQKIGRAVQAYYRDNRSEWPIEIQDLISHKYLTLADACSPWIGVSGQGANCGNFASYFLNPPGKNDVYMLGISIQSTNPAVLNQIAAKLSSAEISGGMLTSYVGMPKIDMEAYQSILITDIQQLHYKGGRTRNMPNFPLPPRTPNCPAGWTPKTAMGLVKFRGEQLSKGRLDIANPVFWAGICRTPFNPSSNTNNSFLWSSKAPLKKGDPYYDGWALVIYYCLPPGMQDENIKQDTPYGMCNYNMTMGY